jgi:hypothetical protein
MEMSKMMLSIDLDEARDFKRAARNVRKDQEVL